MRLTRQLLLLAILTLVLPWAGCQYLRETENVLRQSQQDTLTATAQAMAARLSADAPLAELTGSHWGETQRVYYAHHLSRPMIVDGYDEDWRERALLPQPLALDQAPEGELLLGRHQEQAYALVRVLDAQRSFYDPSLPLEDSDHLKLRLRDLEGRERNLQIYTGAPGQVRVDALWDGGLRHREHRVTGVWTEQLDHYVVELQLPWQWLAGGLGVAAHRGGSHSQAPPALQPVLSRSVELSNLLATGTPVATRIQVVSPGGFVIGSAGGLPPRIQSGARAGEQWFAILLRWLLGQSRAEPLPTPDGFGQIVGESVTQALEGNTAGRWYRLGTRRAVQVAVPVRAAGTAEYAPVQAAVLVEQTTDIWEARLNQVAGRLLVYSLLASALAGLGLFTYASWLSWRIRRLSMAAQSAVDADGHIRGQFPRSRSGDEVGQLSRHYADLLQRLQDYNRYLETLAQKLSHELRTPLAVVRSSLDNLQQLPLSDDAQVYTQRALSGSERLTAILNAMSAASRVEQAIHSSETEVLPADHWLTQMAAAYQDVFPDNHFQCAIAPGDYSVYAAPELLVQMLDKLVDNAVEFSGSGGQIELTLKRDGDSLILQVINDGPPLPEAMQGRIFDSLVSMRAPDTQRHHLGLGLYVVRLIVAFHRGQVVAYNRPEDSGVVFEVRLPVNREKGGGSDN